MIMLRHMDIQLMILLTRRMRRRLYIGRRRLLVIFIRGVIVIRSFCRVGVSLCKGFMMFRRIIEGFLRRSFMN